MDELQLLVSVPIITAIVYVTMTVYKYIINEREGLLRIIPAIALVLGAGLGVAMFYVAPDMIPVSNVFTAILIGAESGLVATGTHQIIKQLQKNEEQNDSPPISQDESTEAIEKIDKPHDDNVDNEK